MTATAPCKKKSRSYISPIAVCVTKRLSNGEGYTIQRTGVNRTGKGRTLYRVTGNYQRCSLKLFNLYEPCILYIGQTYRSSPEHSFYIFSQQIYLIIFLDFLSASSFISPQNFVYFLMLRFLVHKIFTFK